MKKMFLRWWIICCLTTLGGLGLIYTGFFTYLWDTDLSKLSFIIMFIFTVCMAFIGKITYEVSKKSTTVARQLVASETALKPLWYFAEAMLAIGLTGTLIGFYWVLTNSFEGLDITKTAEIKSAMKAIGSGSGTAILTSLVGIVSSTITKFQLVNLEHGRDGKV